MVKKRINKKPKVALAQIAYSLESAQKNVEKIKEYIKKAKKRNCDIVCFPEACLFHLKSFPINHGYIKEIREECKKNKIWCIINDDIIINKKVHNTSLLINREGKVKAHYYKINLYHNDEGVPPGRNVTVFTTELGKIGFAACWDLRFPEHFKKMEQKGAEIVFCPARWCYEAKAYSSKAEKREKWLLRSLAETRAFDNLFFVCLVSPIIRKSYFNDLVSYSGIISPSGVVKQIYQKEGMITARLDLNLLAKLRKLYLRTVK